MGSGLSVIVERTSDSGSFQWGKWQLFWKPTFLSLILGANQKYYTFGTQRALKFDYKLIYFTIFFVWRPNKKVALQRGKNSATSSESWQRSLPRIRIRLRLKLKLDLHCKKDRFIKKFLPHTWKIFFTLSTQPSILRPSSSHFFILSHLQLAWLHH